MARLIHVCAEPHRAEMLPQPCIFVNQLLLHEGRDPFLRRLAGGFRHLLQRLTQLIGQSHLQQVYHNCAPMNKGEPPAG